MSETWKEQESSGEMWLPENKGDELIGQLVNVEQGMYGNQYIIRLPEGNETKTPSHKVLQSRMSRVAIGETIKIVFEGQEPPAVKGQNPTKLYKVYVKEK